MHIQEAFDLIKDDIDRVEVGFKDELTSEAPLINRVGEYILDSGGKRVRPLSLLLSAKVAAYDGASHIPLAVALEFIHTATLLHDDVVDNATLRRGHTSANSVWGNPSSVLVGDYLLSRALTLAVGVGNIDVLRLVSDTTAAMAEGEVKQLSKRSDVNTSEREYLEVVTNKTAVLFSSACRMPAILAELDDQRQLALADFGLELGIAYQLTDDCLDYTSRDEDLGKAVGNDLREGKVTLPLIRAFAEATETEKAIIKSAVTADGADMGHAQLKEVSSIINKYDGIGYTLEEARRRIEHAKKSLEVFEPNVERAALSAVADFVLERNN